VGDDVALTRIRGVQLLVDRIAARANRDEYFFVTGDFNATEDQWPIVYLKGGRCEPGTVCPNPTPTPAFRMLDAWREKHPSRGTGSRCRNNSTDNGTRIDYVFVWSPAAGDAPCASGNCAPFISSAEIADPAPMCPSDHRAVLAELMIPLADQ
jgi:hypothetical protein